MVRTLGKTEPFFFQSREGTTDVSPVKKNRRLVPERYVHSGVDNHSQRMFDIRSDLKIFFRVVGVQAWVQARRASVGGY